MSELEVDHRRLGVHYFTSTWALIDADTRTPEQDREMLASAFTSRQHWADSGGTPENLTVGDWQVAHAASLAGFPEVAMAWARVAVERAESCDLPLWLQASTHEGLARAHAAAGDTAGYEREAQRTRELLAEVEDDGDRDLITRQLASIPRPTDS